jgi:hypothetical protein
LCGGCDVDCNKDEDKDQVQVDSRGTSEFKKTFCSSLLLLSMAEKVIYEIFV